MFRIFIATVCVLGWLLCSGRASNMETISQGANQTGQTVGGAMRIPNSFTEGAASVVAGQPSPNPYNRSSVRKGGLAATNLPPI